MALVPVLPDGARRACVTIGNFDGVHLGHRLLFRRTVELAAAGGLDAVAVTFRPHPRAFFSGRELPPLTDPATRRELLGSLGLGRLLELAFTRELASMTPEEFHRACLAPLGTDVLVVGYDFRLGRNRTGDFDALRALGAANGFSVVKVPPLLLDGEPISSTRLRAAVEAGDMPLAARMLGRFHAARGRVVRGDGRGTGLGFPTANILPGGSLLPPDGVYATRLLAGGASHPAVTNVGMRPTFGGGSRTIESFLLDGGLDLYGQEARVEFLERIRGERRFAGPGELAEQIGRDAARAREICGSPPPAGQEASLR